MKNKGKLLSLIFTCIAAIAVVFVCIFSVEMDSETNNGADKVTTYSLTDTIGDTYLKFEVLDEDAKTCKFIGLTGDLGANKEKTLSIPEYATIGGQEYHVVEVDTADPDALTNVRLSGVNLYSIYAYGSWITALIVPNSVTKFNESAFYGMASLQYISTPFPVEITSSYETQTGDWPIHKLFSKGYYSTNDASYQDEFKRMGAPAGTNQLISPEVIWYDFIKTSEIYFNVPAQLEKVVITKATRFGNRTFVNIESLKEVVLPEGLTTIGEYTFASCDALESVSFPSTLKTPSTGMFSECISIEKMVLPKVAFIPEDCFGGCSSLEEVIMPTSVETIGKKAFTGCVNLHIKLYLDDPAKCYGSDTEAVIFPEKLASIGDFAFSGVKTISMITIPDNVSAIGYGVLQDCPNIEYISLPIIGAAKGTSANGVVSEGEVKANKNAIGYIFGQTGDRSAYYTASQGETAYTIPNKLRTINITNETAVERGALANLCFVDNGKVKYGVTTIIINKGSSIQAGAMQGSNALVDITIPYIGSSTDNTSFGLLFDINPSSATEKNVNKAGAQITGQRSGSFYIPTTLTNVVVTSQATIRTGSFNNCTNLKYVEIGNATTYIEEAIFYNNQSLESIKLPFVGPEQGVYYYYWTYWKNNYLRNMLAWAFSGAKSDLMYEDNYIADGSSYRRYIPLALKTVEITKETVIDYRSFKFLTSIETLTISDNEGVLSRIEAGAAEGCTSIKTLNLPFIGSDYNASGSDGSSHRAGYIFGSSGAGYNAGGYRIPNSLTAINVAYVNRIPANAFYGMNTLTSVTFDTKVTAIGDAAFQGCTSLSQFNYAEDTAFTTVGNYAFYDCQRINEISTPIPAYEAGNLSLGAYAFGKTSISEIDFTKLKSVGDYCFSGCLNLTDAAVTSNIQNFGKGVFADCLFLKNVTLAQGFATEYLFKNCVSLTNIDLSTIIIDGIIPAGMFYGCEQLRWGDGNPANGLVLNDQIVSIGDYAFYGCKSFERFIIPSNTTTIGDYAFNGCSGLESLTIPLKTKKIGKNVFTEFIGGNFVIWVYIEEENWPWQTGWNCLNPVKVLPGTDDSIYTFELADSLRGYVITGFKPEFDGKLSGTIILPKTHDGLPIVGVSSGVFANQVKITKIVVPECYNVIGQGAFNNNKRVDVYFEDKIKNSLIGYDSINKTSDPGTIYKDSASMAKIIAAGLVFYGDYWAYNGSTPSVNAATLKFKVDETTRHIIYNATKWEPAIVNVDLPAIVVTNDIITKVNSNVAPSLFNYSYSNNINAGTANINATINQAEYSDYILVGGDNAVYLYGAAKPTFEIGKAEIKVYYDSDFLYSERETNYNPNGYWKNDRWNSSLITTESISDFWTSYTFGGTLQVANQNAGEYMIFDQERNADFYWSSAWYVRYRGVNVTDNFKVSVFLVLTVNKLDVELMWTGGNLEDDGRYSYEYTASDVTPTAEARTPEGIAVPTCGVDVIRDSAVLTKYPGDVNGARAKLSASATLNYNIVNGEVDSGTAIRCSYYIVNAKLKISIYDYDFVIGYDDTEYRFDNWKNTSYYSTVGLAQGSVINGSIVSVPWGTYGACDPVLYSTQNGGIAWEEQQFDSNGIIYNSNVNPILPFMIGRYDSLGNLIEIENDYYDVELVAYVQINYNEFEFNYVVDGNIMPLKLIKTAEGTTYYETTYHTIGISYPIEIDILNAGLLPATADIRYYFPGNEGTSTPMQLLEVGDYTLGVTVSRNNFTTLRHEVIIHVVRSDVEWNSLDKEYDGLDVDLSMGAFIYKYDVTQTFTLTKCIKSGSTYTKVNSCINPGTYYIHIVGNETSYFNEVDTYYQFTISKRKIHIYVDHAKYFDQSSGLLNSKPWDGNKYYIEINSESLPDSERKFLVGTDNIYGVLWTNGSEPRIYDTQSKGDWYWSPAWAVYDGVSPANKMGVYYDVELHGAFEITYLNMDVTHSGVNTSYDGNLYQTTVMVNDPASGYSIYYSLTEPSISLDPDTRLYTDTGASWRKGANYTFQAPGQYQVWFKVVAKNYQTYYGTDIVNISYVPITWDKPLELLEDSQNKYYIDYDGFAHVIELDNVSPMGANVEYSIDGVTWTNKPFSFTDVYDNYVVMYRISYPNYVTELGSYTFRITYENLKPFDGFVNANSYSDVYDALLHGITVNVTAPDLNNNDSNPDNDYVIYYRVAGSNAPWSTLPVQYVDSGNYTVQFMVSAKGYIPYVDTATISISNATLNGVGISNYAADFDGEAHGVDVVGKDLYPGIEVYYTTNPDIAYLDNMNYSAWSKNEIKYTNVGDYVVYVRFVLKNYDYKTFAGTIHIEKANVPVDFTDGYEVQYLGQPVAVKDLGVTTVHDGYVTSAYYEAVRVGGVYTLVSTTRIAAPQALGTYMVTLTYADTKNCYPATVTFGFDIVPRKLYVDWIHDAEYTGLEQNPNATIDSGTGDILSINMVCYERLGETTPNPTAIGKYHYSFTFSSPQTNYVIVDPASPEMLAYPYIFNITTIDLHINFVDSMDYDYANQKYWHKTSGWEEFDCFNKLLVDHEYQADMVTSSYARGTYTYDSSAPVQDGNVIYVTGDRIINKKTGVDVTEFYTLSYDIKVLIEFPKLTVSTSDKTIPFDGEEHGIDITVPAAVRNLTYYWATEIEYSRDEWRTHKITFSNVGSNKIYFKIVSPNYEDYIGYATLTIVKTHLLVDILPFDEEYDAFEHYVIPTVNASNVSTSESVIRYYSTSEYSIEELESFYASFDGEGSLFEAGLTEMINAGNYYAAVVYPESGNYYTSYTIKEVTLKQRGLDVTLGTSYFKSFDYDGTKKQLTLGSRSLVSDANLVYGHRIVGSTATTIIQTISPNAGIYDGSTGFEFLYNDMYRTIIIKDLAGNIVTTNYKPIVSDSQLQIVINKIQLTEFEASDLTRPYNGKPANPTISTPSDGVVSYLYYKADAYGSYTIPVTAIDACNVGTYYVICDIGEGTNYYAWMGTTVGAYVTIEACTVPVIWKNTSVVFDGTEQNAWAFITDVYGNEQRISANLRYKGALHEGIINAGLYEVIAFISADSTTVLADNYILTGYIGVFEIEEVEFDLVFKDSTDASDARWTMSFDSTRWPDFPATVSLFNEYKNGDPYVETSSNEPGPYRFPYDFTLHLSAWVGDIDVTDSIKFNIDGNVVIVANEITFNAPDCEYDYNVGKEYSAADQFEIISPIARDVIVKWSTGAAAPDSAVPPSFHDVGTYVVNFALSAKDYGDKNGSFTITIKPTESFINFNKSLNKVYNGEAVDGAKVRSVINGEFNGDYNDLIYTFYSTSSQVPLVDAPVDTGEYRVVITSAADLVAGPHNYTTLYEERLFQITPATITLNVELDYEVTSAMLAGGYTTGDVAVSPASIAALGSYNTLHYEIASTTSIIYRGLYKHYGLFNYDPSSSTFNFDVDVMEFAFTWSVMADLRKDPINPAKNLDVSYNYAVELVFSLDIHYPRMQVKIEDVVSDYTGFPVYGDETTAIKVPTSPINLRKYYGSSVTTLNSSNIADYSGTDPGVYVVHYKYTCDGYEDFIGSYTITIGYAQREVNVPSLDKVYDGFTVGTLSYGQYLPAFTTTPTVAGLPDNFDSTKVTITYYKKGYKTPLGSVLDAGVYTYLLKIPHSKYYDESIVEGEFTISRKAIYITGSYTAGYIAKYVQYSDFNTVTSAYKMVYADGTQIEQNFTFQNLTIQTINGTIRNSVNNYYSGKDDSLFIATLPVIYKNSTDVTNNYQVLLYSPSVPDFAKMYISAGEMNVTPYDVTTSYDGKAHMVSYELHRPETANVTYSLSVDGPFVPELEPIIGCGTYTIYMKFTADNYNDKIVSATLVIKQATTWITIPAMDKDYNGRIVTVPTDIATNNTEVTTDKFIYEFERWNEHDQNWVDMPITDYPKDAGKYRLKVSTPATTNYAAANEVIREFEIRGINTSINWGLTTFVYNGESQVPTASFATVGGDVVNKIYTITPSADNIESSNDSITIGIYTVSVTLEGDNKNYIFDPAQTTITYTIVPRNVTIVLNKGVYYDHNYFTFPYSKANGFYVNNIIDGHYVNASLKCKFNSPQNYTSIDQFEWISATGEPIILDSNNENKDVTFNYNFDYDNSDIALNINYSQLTYDVTNYDKPYDGNAHSMTVKINNVFASDEIKPVITYSETLNGTYTSDKPTYTDVTSYQKVYFRITLAGYATINPADNPDPECYGYVNITRMNAGLKFEDEYIVLDKYYDGIVVPNPAVEYSDMSIKSRPVTYKWEKLEENPSKVNYGQYFETTPLDAGTYRLTVTLGGDTNYENAEITRSFVIRKRDITITLPVTGPSSASMEYTGYMWEKSIDTDTMIAVAAGPNTSTGIVPGEKLKGIVQTNSANYGTYDDATDFGWQNGYTIETADGRTVKGNYNVTFDMNVKINKAAMQYKITPYTGSYDAQPHTITVEVTKPVVGATIKYALENVDEQYTETPIYKTTTGILTVYVKITCDNYEDVIKSSIIQIEGVHNDGTLVGPTGDIYYGDIYITPYYSGSSNGTQTVTYFNTLDLSTPLTAKPTNAGTYKYVLHLDSDGIYAEEDYNGQFTIKPLAIEVKWEDLSQEYTGESLKPSATITTLEASDIALAVDDSFAKTDVGTYTVSVAYTDAGAGNYVLKNPTAQFKITKKLTAVPNIKPDMEFRYQFQIPILDENGDPVVDEDGNPQYYTFGDSIVVEDVDGNIYVLDDAGTILEILDKDGTVIDPSPELPYKIIVDTNKDACKDGDVRTIEVVLDDPANYTWDKVSNPDDNQEFTFVINEYTFPDAEDGTTIEATISAGSYEYDDGNEIKPVPTVVLKYAGLEILTLDTSYYKVEYENNTEINDNAKVKITGLGNYDFEKEITFKIIDKASPLIQLKPNVKPIFMQITVEIDGIKVVEDSSVERTEENRDTFYLGHVHHKTFISTLLDQLDTDKEQIKVYDGSGNLVDPAQYGKQYVGTGYKIEYFDKKTGNTLDTIEVVIFGDINGDGEISLADGSVINRMTTTNAAQKISIDKIQDGSLASDTLYSYFTLANYYAALTERAEVTGNSVSLSMKTKILQLTRTKDPINFNAEYEIV